MRNYLKEYSTQALTEWLQNNDQPRFRAEQIREWLYRKYAASAEEMVNLPRYLRRKLDDEFTVFSLCCTAVEASADGTVKYVLSLPDGLSVETVFIPAAGRSTVCISTQVGCPVRCAFCASGAQGLHRDLTVQEIVDQVIFVCRECRARVTNVVVMGIGEPLLNVANLGPALDVLSQPWGVGIGARHITVSTSGIVPGIYTLADLRRQWNLAVSLHAPTDEIRARLIPPQYRYPLRDIVEACRYYREMTSRMVTIEYALIAGVNDDPHEAAALARMATDLKAKVNLIPCNGTDSTYNSPGPRGADAFGELLDAKGVRVTVRRSRGADITAACGQLRAKVMPDSGQPYP